MKWLTSDYSDFYVEEELLINPCGDYIRSRFYVRYAYYNIFGKKKYKRYYETIATFDDNLVDDVLIWYEKEAALRFWKRKIAYTTLVKHKIDCNE